jgi:hypothetical protein
MKRTCKICNRDNSKTDIVSAIIVRPAVAKIIEQSFPGWNPK